MIIDRNDAMPARIATKTGAPPKAAKHGATPKSRPAEMRQRERADELLREITTGLDALTARVDRLRGRVG